MRPIILNALQTPIVLTEREERLPGPGQIRVQVRACGVCRTDLHVVDGDLPNPTLPILLGHEIVGRIERLKPGVDRRRPVETDRATVARSRPARTDGRHACLPYGKVHPMITHDSVIAVCPDHAAAETAVKKLTAGNPAHVHAAVAVPVSDRFVVVA